MVPVSLSRAAPVQSGRICATSSSSGCLRIVVLDNFVRGRRDNLAWAEANGPVQVVEGDICDRALVDESTAGMDLAFHQAAIRITQCAEEPRLAKDVMIDGTYNVLESAVKHNVNKVVSAASSASVYGLAETFPTDESHHPYANDTLYGAAKVFNEGLLRSFHAMYGLDYVALRYFNVYGPRMDIHGVYTEVLVRWMERIQSGTPPLIMGDGQQTMDFVYIPEIARANILAAESDITDRVYNIASGTETSLVELAEMLLKVMGSDLGVEFGPERVAEVRRDRVLDDFAGGLGHEAAHRGELTNLLGRAAGARVGHDVDRVEARLDRAPCRSPDR